MSRKVLFAFWHGLGDNILATPSIKKYKDTTRNYVGWAMLRRFRQADLFGRNPYIDQLHWTSDAWHDFEDYPSGCLGVKQEAFAIKEEFAYDEIRIIDHTSSHKHKILRTAEEMGVDLDGDFHTYVYFDHAHIQSMYETVSLPKDYVFFHGTTGVPRKNISLEWAKTWLKREGINLPIVSPDFTWDLNKYPIGFAMHVMKHAKHILVADSALYHAAHAMDLRVDGAYFVGGEGAWHDVHPLHTDRERIIGGSEDDDITKSLIPPKMEKQPDFL